jgi:hypothetical protein
MCFFWRVLHFLPIKIDNAPLGIVTEGFTEERHLAKKTWPFGHPGLNEDGLQEKLGLWCRRQEPKGPAPNFKLSEVVHCFSVFCCCGGFRNVHTHIYIIYNIERYIYTLTVYNMDFPIIDPGWIFNAVPAMPRPCRSGPKPGRRECGCVPCEKKVGGFLFQGFFMWWRTIVAIVMGIIWLYGDIITYYPKVAVVICYNPCRWDKHGSSREERGLTITRRCNWM